jgi:hypothetical protein
MCVSVRMIARMSATMIRSGVFITLSFGLTTPEAMPMLGEAYLAVSVDFY